MINQTVLDLMLAVATAELFHAISEMMSARFKAGQLDDWIHGRRAKTMRVNVNTRAKAYAVLATVAVVLVGVSFAVYSAVSLSASTAVVVTLVIVAATYAITGFGFDHFHVVVGRVGRLIRASHPEAGGTATSE